MTKEEAIADLKSINATGMECIDYAIAVLEQLTSDNCVSRQAVTDAVENTIAKYIPIFLGRYEKIPLEVALAIRDVPPVTPTRKVGRWVYDKASQNWRCSECNETPKTLGYVGTTDFMEKEFAFCNHCGAEMVGAGND